MNPAEYDLTIYQGKTFTKTLILKDSAGDVIDFTGAEVRMQVRPSYGSDTKLVDLTEANGRVSTTPASGQIDLLISATDTAAMSISGGVYDIEIEYADGVVDGILRGSVTLVPEVTR